MNSLRRALSGVALAAALFASTSQAATLYVLTTDGKLNIVDSASPGTILNSFSINGVAAGETLVAIDVRPQNQQLYGLGVNATANTATLYCISLQTGYAAVVGAAPGTLAFTTDGSTPVDLPDATTTGWDIDFNPSADRLRVVAGSLNFRVNPNTGGAVDGDNGGAAGSVTGLNPDGPINSGTTTLSAVAYTNSQPNNGNITTLYTLDGTTNSLYIQNPPNAGTQGSGQTVTLGGNALDFATVAGFDIPPGVNTSSNNSAVISGSGFALLTVGGTPGLYSINLVNGAAVSLGTVSNGRSMAVRTELGAAIALSSDGANLVRFNPASPGTTTTQAINVASLVAGETLVGIDCRPQTGQLYGLGINATANTGTLYLLDPQTGALTAIGTAGQIAFTTDGVTAVDLPDLGSAGYGIDFNPSVDRIRVTTSTGLNFRVNPNTGASVDGNNGSVSAVSGVNPDGPINGSGVTGISATAYTNSFGRDLAVAGPTTLYTLDAATNALYLQNPPNNGTQTSGVTVTSGGNTLDFTGVNGFDIPASVLVSTSNAVATGEGWAVLNVGGVTGVYRLNLSTGVATNLGAVGVGSALSGLVIFGTPSFQITASNSIDFGDVVVGSAPTTTFTISNPGSHALSYTTSVQGTTFSVSQNASGLLAPGGSVQVELTYDGVGAGADNALLTITTNDPVRPSTDVTLAANSFFTATDDSVVVTTGGTRIKPLANDGIDASFVITDVSDPTIDISLDGRSLFVPANFAGGSFTYTASDGVSIYVATITVNAVAPVAAIKAYTGIVETEGGFIIGAATLKLGKNGTATIAVVAGASKTSAKLTFPTGGDTATAFTSLGYLSARKIADGTVNLFISALGGGLGASLRPVVATATAEKHHIALAATDSVTYPGGGYAIAQVSAKGAIKVTGLLPDGVPFSAAATLRDNATFVFYTAVVKGPKPPAFIGGELSLADLTSTDVTGELKWNKLPQFAGVKGLHLDGVDATLFANGCRFDGTATLPAGNGTLSLGGGNITVETNAVIVSTAGVPAPAVGSALKTWTGVNKKVGKFKATVAVPNIVKPVKGSGLYLPKTNSAWGFFPGTAVGGRIQLTVP